MFNIFLVMALFEVPFSLYLVVIRGNVPPKVALAYVASVAIYIPLGCAAFVRAILSSV